MSGEKDRLRGANNDPARASLGVGLAVSHSCHGCIRAGI